MHVERDKSLNYGEAHFSGASVLSLFITPTKIQVYHLNHLWEKFREIKDPIEIEDLGAITS